MAPHEWLTQELASLAWYAHYLREALLDPEVLQPGKNACAAAAKYLVEWEDLIPDTDPLFGYVDDLFAVLLGFQQLAHQGGPAGKTYVEMELPSGATLSQRIAEAKSLFGPFWDYLEKELQVGFREVAMAIEADPAHVDQLVTMLKNYIDGYMERTVAPIDADALARFLAQYQ
ncbi:DUF1232 domain-containing protein [Planctomycetota bacterium]